MELSDAIMTTPPTTSGIYLVRLSGEQKISVNADRERIAERCIHVNNENCKYGKSLNLRRRYLDYCRVFGVGRVIFDVIIETDKIHHYEQMLHECFRSFRMRGHTGRENEWLEDIDPVHALEKAKSICNVGHSAEVKLPSYTKRFSTKGEVNMSKSDIQAGIRSNDHEFLPSEILHWVYHLEKSGMTNEQLKDLHHFPQRTQTLNSVKKYFSKNDNLVKGGNVNFAARLSYVYDGLEAHHSNLNILITESLALYPKE